jgi:glycosyltransferase involved in cell wall biosynthesis
MKVLLLFNIMKLEDMIAKGNVWYVRHYEAYFDQVYVVYLFGRKKTTVTQGRTHLVSLASRSAWLNLFLAPFRLWGFARQIHPTRYLTADQVFAWWTSCLLVMFHRAKIVLMPVCIPEEIYASTGRSLAAVLPIWLERVFIRWSYAVASRVVTGKNISVYINWLSSMEGSRKKLRIVDILVDELPSIEFFEALSNCQEQRDEEGGNSGQSPVLLYVGRLHREKMVSDLIYALREIMDAGHPAKLVLVGDGEERSSLQQLAQRLGLRDNLEFVGSKKTGELVQYYKSAALFLSPLTGTALREAALCGVPVVAYNSDWVRGILKDGDNALLAEQGDKHTFAQQVIRALGNPQLRESLARNLKVLAELMWSTKGLQASLTRTFAFDDRA